MPYVVQCGLMTTSTSSGCWASRGRFQSGVSLCHVPCQRPSMMAATAQKEQHDSVGYVTVMTAAGLKTVVFDSDDVMTVSQQQQQLKIARERAAAVASTEDGRPLHTVHHRHLCGAGRLPSAWRRRALRRIHQAETSSAKL